MIARRVDRKIGSLDKTRLIGELPIPAFCSIFFRNVQVCLCRLPAALQLFALSCLVACCFFSGLFLQFCNLVVTFAIRCIGIDL